MTDSGPPPDETTESVAAERAATPPAAAPNGSRPWDRMPRWVPKAIALFWIGFVLTVLFRWVFGRLETLLIMLLVSLFLALAIEPAVNALARRGWRRGVATGVVMLALLAFLVGFVAIIGTLLFNQVSDLIDKAPDYVQDVEDWINETFPDANVNADDLIAELTREGGPVRRFAESLAGSTLDLGTTALGLLLQLLSIGLFTFYMVADGPRLRRALCSFLRPDVQREVLRAWEVAIDKTGGYLYSRALLALLSSVFHYIAFSIIGIPYPVALAIWVGIISQFIPVIGTYLAGVLPVLVALVGDPVDALWVLGVIVVYQQIENYLFAPRITARTMEIHPAVAFGSVIAGGALLGAVGALLALPFAASVQAFLTIYVRRHDVVDSHLVEPTVSPHVRRRGKPFRAPGARPPDSPDSADQR
jgi:predicted PurR-regulated permease PerM